MPQCNICEKFFPEEQCFRDKETKKVWCLFCMSKEKYKREKPPEKIRDVIIKEEYEIKDN